MRTLSTDDFSCRIADHSVVTIGNFDGVHGGHRQIFKRVCGYALDAAAEAVVVTFDPHPLQLLNPVRAPRLITTLEQKCQLIAESDIDLLVIIPFTTSFADITADKFVREVLVTSLGMRRLVIGHDYAFGKNREGNEQLLRQLSVELNFTVDALDPVGDGELVFSSSAVRQLVAAGDISTAARLLGRLYRISGRVVHGREIGRSLGFPTANIDTVNQLIPADGVYAVWVEVFGRLHMGACSVGVNPTFGGVTHSIEAFIFDFDGTLYDAEISIHFAARLRDVARFADVAALTQQINEDVAAARLILSAELPARCTV